MPVRTGLCLDIVRPQGALTQASQKETRCHRGGGRKRVKISLRRIIRLYLIWTNGIIWFVALVVSRPQNSSFPARNKSVQITWTVPAMRLILGEQEGWARRWSHHLANLLEFPKLFKADVLPLKVMQTLQFLHCPVSWSQSWAFNLIRCLWKPENPNCLSNWQLTEYGKFAERHPNCW